MCGLIPAYAGRTALWRVLEVLKGAHPRLRGADLLLPTATFEGGGSSPLTRGGQFLEGVFYLLGGLIPAYAGRTAV